jgi:WD40 repeat protein
MKACAQHNEFIATGAEDTTIRIWRHHTTDIAGQEIPLECCAVLEKHSTGIQHLQWRCASGDYHNLFSAGGVEEFYVWAISIIPGFGVGVICEAVLTDQSEEKDLRIMGSHVELFTDNAPPEHHKYHITLIYSDSAIKTYHYSRQDGFMKIAHGTYTSACLTQISGLREGWPHHLLTASTDGNLCIWSYQQLPSTDVASVQEITLHHYLCVHQSSVSSLAIKHLTHLPSSSDQWTLVATAGDDNALTLTLFHFPIQDNAGKSENIYTPVRRIHIPSAHAAGITGIAFKPSSGLTVEDIKAQCVQLWSVGGDQRVKRWNVEVYFEPDSLALRKGASARVDIASSDQIEKRIESLKLKVRKIRHPEDDAWTSVADPGGLVAFGRHRRLQGEGFENDRQQESFALVVGNGMEVFKMRDDGFDGEGILVGREMGWRVKE